MKLKQQVYFKELYVAAMNLNFNFFAFVYLLYKQEKT